MTIPPAFFARKLNFYTCARVHMCPKDLVNNRNISNILEEAPICLTNWNLSL